MDFEMIAANELDRYIRDKNAFIIDLRTPQEYVARHIQGAVNIPYESLENCQSLPRNMTLVLYCERDQSACLQPRNWRPKAIA